MEGHHKGRHDEYQLTEDMAQVQNTGLPKSWLTLHKEMVKKGEKVR